MPIIRQSASKVDGNPINVDEVVQRIRQRLFVGEPGAAPAIATYRGTGPLSRWLRVIATRVAVDMRRSSAHIDTDEGLAELVAPDDPELALIWQTCADAYKRALAHAVKTLERRGHSRAVFGSRHRNDDWRRR